MSSLDLRPNIRYGSKFSSNTNVRTFSQDKSTLFVHDKSTKKEVLTSKSSIKRESGFGPFGGEMVKYTTVWANGKVEKYRSTEGKGGHQKLNASTNQWEVKT